MVESGGAARHPRFLVCRARGRTGSVPDMTTIQEIGDQVYAISTYCPYGPPGGITYNQFLIVDEQPLVVHTGMRMHAEEIMAAAARVAPLRTVRWITSNHASRPDELGSVDRWFAAAEHARVIHGEIACMVNLADMVERPPQPAADGEVLEVGSHRLRWRATPHVPGPWEAGFWFEETTRILFTGDLFAQAGRVPAVTAGDVVAPAVELDNLVHGTAMTPATAPSLRGLMDLRPATLALMHGPAYTGDCSAALGALADHFQHELDRTSGGPGTRDA